MKRDNMQCYECDGLGFQEEEELEDIEIYHNHFGFIEKIERYSIKYDLDLSVLATAFASFRGYHSEYWVLCPYCDGWGKE